MTFLQEALKKHNLRLSGRLPSHFRSFDIKFYSPYHLLLTMGDTIITCRLVATVEKVPPTASKLAQSHGQFKMQVEYQSQRKRDIERLVDRILRGSKALDLEELCILVGQWVWNIDMNVRIVRNGGNELDAVVLGVIALLLRFRRPHVDIHVGDESAFDKKDEMFIPSEDKVKQLLEKESHSTLKQRITIHEGGERDPIPLSVHHIPLSVTFALFSTKDDANQLIYVIDPDFEEQAIAEGLVSIAVNTHGEICSIEKSGGIALSPQCILQCVKMATVKVKEMSKALIKIVEADIAKYAEAKVKKYKAYNDSKYALQENDNNEENNEMTDSDVSDISSVDTDDEIILPSKHEISQQQKEVLRRMMAEEEQNLIAEEVPLVQIETSSEDEMETEKTDETHDTNEVGKSWKEHTKSQGLAMDLSAAILPKKKKVIKEAHPNH